MAGLTLFEDRSAGGAAFATEAAAGKPRIRLILNGSGRSPRPLRRQAEAASKLGSRTVRDLLKPLLNMSSMSPTYDTRHFGRAS
jgi:hypothetical protein